MSSVYVICDRVGGPILEADVVKIGFTEVNPRTRVKALQTGSPKPLHLVCSLKLKNGDMARSMEKLIHWRLAHLKSGGEWFKYNLETKRFIYEVLPHLGRFSFELGK